MIETFLRPHDPRDVSSRQLEAILGPRTSIVVNSYQSALQMCFEVLGTADPEVVIPIIMPVSAAPSTAAAAWHARGALVLMDVDEESLQMRPDELQETLDNLEHGAIVVFNRPGGQAITKELLDVVYNRCPVVVDSRVAPKLPLNGDDLVGDFIVYDIGFGHDGAFVLHRYTEQLAQMHEWRSGLLGHSADMTPSQAARARSGLTQLNDQRINEQEAVKRYQAALKDKVKILFNESPHWPYLVIEVADADLALAHLASLNVEVYRAVTPLHTLQPFRERFAEEDNPEYPRAEALSKRFITLPVQPHLLNDRKIEKLCEYVCEVA